GKRNNLYLAWNVEINPRPIRGSIIPEVLRNNTDDFAQATLLKSPTTTVGFLLFLSFLATANNSPSRSLEFSSSDGCGDDGCTLKNVIVAPSGVCMSDAVLGIAHATR